MKTEMQELLIYRDGDIDWDFYEARDRQARAEALRSLPLEGLKLMGRGAIGIVRAGIFVVEHIAEQSN